MPIFIGMDTILCPVQNRDLWSINCRSLRKLFHKATCKLSHHEQALSHIQSTASFPACILIHNTENLPCSRNKKVSKWIDIWEQRSILSAVTSLINIWETETSRTLGGTQKTTMWLPALTQHLHSSRQMSLYFHILVFPSLHKIHKIEQQQKISLKNCSLRLCHTTLKKKKKS